MNIIALCAAGVCLTGMLVLCALAVRATDREYMDEMEETGIVKMLTVTAGYIYDIVFLRHKRLRSEKVEMNLRTMNPGLGLEQKIEAYYIEKIRLTLVILIAGAVIALFYGISVRKESILIDGNRMEREESGGRDVKLIAQSEDGEELGVYDLTIEERMLTKNECDELIPEVCEALTVAILNGNASTDEVNGDLDLVRKLEGYPFRIEWRSGNYSRMYSDGTVVWDELPEEGEALTLYAELKYGDWMWEHAFTVHVKNPVKSEGEALTDEIRDSLDEAQDMTRHEEAFILPEEYSRGRLVWKEIREDKSVIILILIVIASVLIFVARDMELQSRISSREESLQKDYPRFVSRITLYLQAGMTTRGILMKLARDYLSGRQEGEKEVWLYEEVTRVAYELENGVSEGKALEHFSRRCRTQEYTRLTALLSQNLTKGSAGLIAMLKEESAASVTTRLNRARKAGEQASTRLMLPMMLMLGVVMVLIMVPAYMSF